MGKETLFIRNQHGSRRDELGAGGERGGTDESSGAGKSVRTNGTRGDEQGAGQALMSGRIGEKTFFRKNVAKHFVLHYILY